MSATFVALYRGETISSAKLVAVSSDEKLIEIVAKKLLNISSVESEDPVLEALAKGKKNALRAVHREATTPKED